MGNHQLKDMEVKWTREQILELLGYLGIREMTWHLAVGLRISQRAARKILKLCVNS